MGYFFQYIIIIIAAAVEISNLKLSNSIVF